MILHEEQKQDKTGLAIYRILKSTKANGIVEDTNIHYRSQRANSHYHLKKIPMLHQCQKMMEY